MYGRFGLYFMCGGAWLFPVYALAVLIARARDESSEGSQCLL